MTSPTTDQHRSPLPVLSLLLAAAAAIIGLVAIATDDVSSRPSQIVVTPLDDSHPAAAPDNARPANQEVDDANDHPHYNPPENARPSHVLVPELDDSHPAAAPDNARPANEEVDDAKDHP
jgi:hypothetical protein